ncbi:hypothetical protein E4Z66_01900 [Aliishimia ponticola]|uniref:STAS domain-containing protein n=1 Tax=Aliishimia ponticola TaxID=2499833 RepID=A0A4S4NJC6_9RHOB|nr:hypothetical protein [Aliishimia ponticola]THH38348.1 hypothetical protein E4Z66_01900 [Aliishimia ponticola]
MPIGYRILPERELVFVKYWGMTDISESFACFSEFCADPLALTARTHLVDLTEITAYHLNRATATAMRDAKFDSDIQLGMPLRVYLAKTEPSRRLLTMMAELGIVGNPENMRIAQTESDALATAGLNSLTFDDLNQLIPCGPARRAAHDSLLRQSEPGKN